MIQIRKSKERGSFDHGWLKTHHSFSFGDYYEPEQMGFSSLRVINEDFVAPGQGFGTHPHRDMEIITYVLEGALEHKDSMGNGSVIRPGEAQYMSAGKGVTHSEFNHSKLEPVHLLQIWILPNENRLPPAYDQKAFAEKERRNRLCLIASETGESGSIKIRQDAKLFTSLLDASQGVKYEIQTGRQIWIQMIQGKLKVNQANLSAGDGAAITAENSLQLLAEAGSAEFLLFDLN